ncbi:hypothetical protein I4Q68_000734 [Campylobacter lari]|uniref:hypothetical protein n=1 Tax=Campylobacter lari TaxID=201 RepID=UPI001275914A|nr:hypothetical protein [Campylobacter lari]EAK0950613.1 hypothetical protein [Campylobacter lari]EGK8007588.1 hypothetical protein [Campylobacter lari]EGQ5682210.1 hypothetical protein [Campylobacter lari]EHL8053276.1 hypothetical protein [Campylobacter lari]MCR2074868.1 hypothetical protein [Campylobacter lari subsp. concheus]
MLKELKFDFKENRNYIQGPDIYNTILSIYGDNIASNFELSFHNIAYNNLILTDTKPDDLKDLRFICSFTAKDSLVYCLYGIDNQFSKPTFSRSYPEENITKNTTINHNEKSIILNNASNFTYMEEIVALNKHLMNNIFPQIQGKWYFTKLQLQNIPLEKSYPIKIVFKSNFNFLIIKSEIYFDNKLLGFIYFSLK